MQFDRLRRMLVDSPSSFGGRARSRRWAMFADAFPGIETMRLLDLGGTADTWLNSPVKPAQVTVLNLFEPGLSDSAELVALQGDACQATQVLEKGGFDTRYDIVFSNSLIEHVGGHARRCEVANEIAQLAPRHWIQTPYRYFPLEPHWLFPAMQFMPRAAQVKIAMRWPLAHTRPETIDQAQRDVLWTELVSATEMRSYFPNSEIVHERVLGLTKSLIALSKG